jgi:hypothetical protein
MRVTFVSAMIVVLALLSGRAVDAQPRTPGTAPGGAGRLEVAVAGVWAGDADLGSADASLTPNLNGSAYTLFEAGATYASPKGGEVRVSYRVAPWLLVGVTGALASGDVKVRVSADVEGGTPGSFAGEPLGQSLVEGRADVLMTRWRFWKARATPYLTVSGGGLRQWHDGNLHVDTGTIIQGGAGLRYGVFTRARPRAHTVRVGAAAELRVARVSGGFHWGREQRTMPSARLECFMGWGR